MDWRLIVFILLDYRAAKFARIVYLYELCELIPLSGKNPFLSLTVTKISLQCNKKSGYKSRSKGVNKSGLYLSRCCSLISFNVILQPVYLSRRSDFLKK